MAKKNSKYDAMFAEISAKVQKSNEGKKKETAIYSKGDRIAMTHALLNSPEYETSYFVKAGEGEPKEITFNPSKELRNALKPTIQEAFGIDKAEINKLDTVEFNKATAAALVKFEDADIKGYVGTGRKIKIDPLAENDSTLSIAKAVVKENVVETKKIEKVGDEYKLIPTGKTIKTESHTAYKSKSQVPAWCKKQI